ncbi:MAG: hypothetical protein IT539_00315 [Bradyrhizobiaceae bacterium]|nr:hypothetical protein [Bradyrhizobiaceae bacterium]
MTSRKRRKWSVLAAFAGLLAGIAPALSQLDYNFMPKGGKALLLEILGSPPDTKELLGILSAKRGEAEWRQAVAGHAKSLSEREQQTLAAYLAINMPVENPELIATKAAKREDLDAALPRDGRELGFYECQFCHSLFTSHLTQARSYQAWMNMFQSPFHRELKMTGKEREEFSRYSEINMPMKIEDVPPDLRF